MRRQIIRFALGLLALCGLLTALRLRLGIPYEQFERAREHWQITVTMTAVEAAIGLGCCAVAWQIARGYNGDPPSSKAFPDLLRAVAFAFMAVGISSLGDAACHWLGTYWSLLLIKTVVAGVLGWAAVVWILRLPDLRRWLRILRDAERG